MAFDNLKFWKKEEPEPPFDLAQSAGLPQLNDPMPQFPDPAMQGPDRPAQYPMGTPFPGTQQWPEPKEETVTLTHRDIDLILAKLDAIRSELDALHQRVRKIEQSTDTTNGAQKRYW